jgi:hypothetical protein
MGHGVVRSHQSMDGRVTIIVPDTGFVFSISFPDFNSDYILIFCAQLCPATVSYDMKYVYISVIIFNLLKNVGSNWTTHIS